jgi:hypothetical protein
LNFHLFAHHKPVFLFHYDRFHLLFVFVAVTDSDDVSQEVEVGSVDRPSEVSGLLQLQVSNLVLLDFDPPDLDCPVLAQCKSTSEQLIMYLSASTR